MSAPCLYTRKYTTDTEEPRATRKEDEGPAAGAGGKVKEEEVEAVMEGTLKEAEWMPTLQNSSAVHKGRSLSWMFRVSPWCVCLCLCV